MSLVLCAFVVNLGYHRCIPQKRKLYNRLFAILSPPPFCENFKATDLISTNVKVPCEGRDWWEFV